MNCWWWVDYDEQTITWSSVWSAFDAMPPAMSHSTIATNIMWWWPSLAPRWAAGDVSRKFLYVFLLSGRFGFFFFFFPWWLSVRGIIELYTIKGKSPGLDNIEHSLVLMQQWKLDRVNVIKHHHDWLTPATDFQNACTQNVQSSIPNHNSTVVIIMLGTHH